MAGGWLEVRKQFVCIKFHRFGVNHKNSKFVSCENIYKYGIQWAITDWHTNELEQIHFTITTHILSYEYASVVRGNILCTLAILWGEHFLNSRLEGNSCLYILKMALVTCILCAPKSTCSCFYFCKCCFSPKGHQKHAKYIIRQQHRICYIVAVRGVSEINTDWTWFW